MASHVQVSSTPNEHALKFTVNQTILTSGHKTYSSLEQAAESPVAKKLFEIEGVASVFLIQDFITVTKKPEAIWLELQDKVVEAIKATI